MLFTEERMGEGTELEDILTLLILIAVAMVPHGETIGCKRIIIVSSHDGFTFGQ